MIRILLVDDHQLVIDGIRLILSGAADMTCVGAANNGEQALQQLRKTAADVVLLDINMSGMNGIETCLAIHTRHPEVKILVLSMLKEAGIIKLMLRNGAAGYLLKDTGQEEVLRAIRRVHQGKPYYSPEVAEAVMASLGRETAPAKEEGLFPELTTREKEVLRLIVEENTTAEIAEALRIKFGTVESHRRNLLIKLGARNTAGLVRVCLQYDLLNR